MDLSLKVVITKKYETLKLIQNFFKIFDGYVQDLCKNLTKNYEHNLSNTLINLFLTHNLITGH